MKLPIFKLIRREDLTDAPDWIDKLLSPINKFFETIYAGLNKNITLNENINCQIREIEFTTGANYGDSPPVFETLKFNRSLKSQAQHCILTFIENKDTTYANFTDAVTLTWRDINGIINIGHITGLANSTNYKIRLLLF